MDLREYLFRKRISVTDFAKKIGYDRAHVSRIVNGSKPGKHMAATIERLTDGEVTVKELLGEK